MKKILILIIVILLGGSFLNLITSRESKLYSGGKDTYKSLGNGRFQIGSINSGKSLFDLKTTPLGIMYDIEKYIHKDPYIYIVGYYTQEKIEENNPNPSYSSYNPQTKEEINFESIEEIPRYIVLNYRTGEIELFIALEEAPKEYQKIFQEPLTFKCKFWNDCYEKEES